MSEWESGHDLRMGRWRLYEYAPDAYCLQNLKTGETINMAEFNDAMKVHALFKCLLEG